MIPDTTHTDLQAADASEPHFNALVLEAGRARYPRPTWWPPGTRVIITRPEVHAWGDFPEHDKPLYWTLESVPPNQMHGSLAPGLPYQYTLGYDLGRGYTVEFSPTPQGGEVVVPA
jgi:hypothetical protein